MNSNGTPASFYLTLPERFIRKIVVAESGCWLWQGALSRGYGSVKLERKWSRAHRAVYRLLVGEIPDGLQLDHLCHGADADCPGGATCVHRRCVNPLHLEPVTARVNTRRSKSIAAVRAAQTHCINGHPFDDDNTGRFKGGQRFCRECHRQRKANAERKPRVKAGLVSGDHRHGSVNGYSNHGCRCDDCRAAWAAHMAEYKQRRKLMPKPTYPAHVCTVPRAVSHTGGSR